MAADFKSKVTGFFSGLKKAAGEAVESQEIALARGKTASKAVYTDAGQMIVDAGQIIDDAAIEMARRSGKLGALAATAVSSKAQDLKDKARAVYASTPEGVEAKSMATSEQYIEARRYIGRVVSSDVTDLRGNVIIAAGVKIDDEHVRAAREADQLGSLIFAAEQSPPTFVAAPPPAVRPVQPPPTPSKRAARPLSEYYDEEEK